MALSQISPANAQTYDPYSILAQFNVVVPGTVAVNTDVEGRAIIGTLNTYFDTNSGHTYGVSALFGGGSANGFGDSAVTGTATLTDTVSGNVTTYGTLNVNNVTANVTSVTTQTGNLYYGTNSGTASINANGGGTVTSGVTTNLAPLVAALNGLQTALSALTTTSTATPNSGVLTLALGSNPTGIDVFSINASTLASATSLSFTGQAQSIVINVVDDTSGTLSTALSDNANVFNGTGLQAGDVIWNFGDLSTISLNGEWEGTILAGNATVTEAYNNDIEGDIYAQNLYAGEEVHNYHYSPVTPPTTPPVTPPPSVPEPSTLALLFSGCIGMAVVVNRRRRRSG